MQVTLEHEEAQVKAECWPEAPSKAHSTCLFTVLLFASLYLKLVLVGSSCVVYTATSVSQEVARKGRILGPGPTAVSQPAHNRALGWRVRLW